MSGRLEQDRAREEWIKEKLVGQPQILQDYMLSIKKKTSSTRKAYLGYLVQYIRFMDEQGIDIIAAKPMHIDRYVDFISDGNGNSIINTKLAAVSDFYKFLGKNDLVKENPCSSDMKLKKESSDEVIFLTDEEVEKIKVKVTSGRQRHAKRNLCIVTLGCSTGLRVSAIRNIDIEDIDFEKKAIHVIEKGNKKREVFIGDNTIRVIKSWMREREQLYGTSTGPLFMSQKKNRLSVRTIEEMIHDAAEGIDKHITPHKMRSTCAMKLYDLTGDIYLTAQQLGHSNISNTMIYAKAKEDKRREAANLLD